MSKDKFIVFLSVLFFITNMANGWIFMSLGNLYITPTTSHSGLPTYVYNGASDRVTSPNSVYCVQAITTNGCYIQQNSTYTLGNYVSYNSLPCPFDEYTWVLIGATICCASYFFYRKSYLTIS